MPSEQGVGLHQQQGVTPTGNEPGEQHQQAAPMGPEWRSLHLARRDDQLLTKQHVLGDEFAASPKHIARETGDQWQRSGESPEGSSQLGRGAPGESSKLIANQGNHGRDLTLTG